jgi:hypothetical protein
MDEIEGYAEDNVVNYNKVLNYYKIAYEKELTTQQKIEIYTRIVNSYEEIGGRGNDRKSSYCNI